jgi:predicted amidophosphoribosyltransferase
MRCPTCRAPWREEPACQRCGSDLTPVMRVAAAAFHHRTAATDALTAGRWSEALHHATEANHLHRTEHGDVLVLMARLVQA